MNSENAHVSVLKHEVLEMLSLEKGNKVLDATLGLGGHSEAILEQLGLEGYLTGLDADEENLQKAQSRLENYSQQTTFVHTNFRDVLQVA